MMCRRSCYGMAYSFIVGCLHVCGGVLGKVFWGMRVCRNEMLYGSCDSLDIDTLAHHVAKEVFGKRDKKSRD